MTDEQRIKELAAKLAEAEQRIADIQQRVCVAVEQRDEAIRQRDRGDICRMACKARDELEAKLVEAENLLRTDSDGNIRSVFYMEGQAEKAERERDELKAKLAEAEKRNDTLLSHNKALANGLQNDGLWSQDHEELIRATRERDELKAALDKTREALELAESRLAYCVVPGLAECARDELKAKLSAAECLLGEVESGAIQVNDDLKRGREIEEESRKRLDTLEEIAAAVTELREAWNDMEACPDSGQGCPDSVLVRLLQWGCRPVCERLCTLEGLVDPYREEPAEGKS